MVGGGHNGLTAAAYLARGGCSVLVLERRAQLGGACTIERPFGDRRFVVSPCAYLVGLLDPLVVEELDLRGYGLRTFLVDPTQWTPFEDGRALTQWRDPARTASSAKSASTSARLGAGPSQVSPSGPRRSRSRMRSKSAS